MNLVEKPQWYEQYSLRLLSDLVNAQRRAVNDLLTDTRAVEVASTSATYSWDGYQYGQLWITHSSGAALEIGLSTASETLANWQRGRALAVVVYNGTGAPLVVTFTSDFLATGATLAAGSTGTAVFLVKPVGFTATSATLVEI